jgi:hypothetical protein
MQSQDLLRKKFDAVGSIPVAGDVDERIMDSFGPKWKETIPKWSEVSTVQISGIEQDMERATGSITVDASLRSGHLIGEDEKQSQDDTGNDVASQGEATETHSDALAWYLPMSVEHSLKRSRVRPYKPWGIYVRALGIELIAKKYVALGGDSYLAPSVAFELLKAHELGHYHLESLVTNLELSGIRPFYLESLLQSPQGIFSEEGFCNARAARAIGKMSLQIMKPWFHSSPAGYSDWERHKKITVRNSYAEVIQDMLNSCTGPSNYRVNEARFLTDLDGPSEKQDAKLVPVFLILDGTGPGGWPSRSYMGPIEVLEAPSFKRELTRELDPKWKKVKRMLLQGALSSGTRLEKLKGLDNAYSTRVDHGARAGLVKVRDKWIAVLISQDHDKLYDQMVRKDLIKQAEIALSLKQ